VETNETSPTLRKPQKIWQQIGTPRALWISIAVVVSVRLGFFLAFGRYSPLRGDENYYWRNTQQILDLTFIEPVPGQNLKETLSEIVANGWFVPGMSVILAPARLVTDQVWGARLWVGIVSLGVLLLVVRRLWTMYNPSVAVITFLIVGLLPYTVWFSMTFWGGHIGGSIMVLNILWTIRMTREIRAGHDPPIKSLLLLGISIAACVYIRPTTMGQLAPIAGLFFFAYAEHGSFVDALKRSVPRWAIVFATFLVLFLPWNIALMVKFDGPFLVVTSRPLAQIIQFGDPAELEEVGSSFGDLFIHLQLLAEERDEGFYSVTMSERERILSDVTFDDRISTIKTSSRNFFDRENEFLTAAMRKAAENESFPMSKAESNTLRARITGINSWMWLGLTIVSLYAVLRRWKIWDGDGFLGIALQASMIMALFQPLNGGPHGRHISFLVMLFAVSSALAINTRLNPAYERPPAIQWPRAERAAANTFLVLILVYLAFYFVY